MIELFQQSLVSQAALQAFISNFTEGARQIQQALLANKELWEALRIIQAEEFAKSLGEDVKKVFATLAERSWCLGLDVPGPVHMRVLELVEADDEKGIEDLMIEYHRWYLPTLEENVCAKYPNRARIFKSAFAAHQRGEYLLAIPAFLSQIDGLSEDIFEASFFQSRRAERAVAERIQQWKLDDLAQCFAHPLILKGLIRENTDLLPMDRPVFNRHAVMHGLSVNYDNEANSLRCISYIGFLVSFFEYIQEKKQAILAP